MLRLIYFFIGWDILNKKLLRSGLIYFVLLIIAIYLAVSVFGQPKVNEIKSFNKFVKIAESNQIKKAVIFPKKQSVEGTLKSNEKFRVFYSEDFPMTSFLEKQEVDFRVDPNAQSVSWTDYIPFLIFGGFIIFILIFFVMSVSVLI